jgi:hypothetical protein
VEIKVDLSELHIPENWRSELQTPCTFFEIPLAGPILPRARVEGDLLDLVGKLFPFRLIGRAQPVGSELLDLRNVRPAEPGVRTCARQSEVDSGVDDVRSMKPGVKYVPAAFVGRRRRSHPALVFLSFSAVLRPNRLCAANLLARE